MRFNKLILVVGILIFLVGTFSFVDAQSFQRSEGGSFGSSRGTYSYVNRYTSEPDFQTYYKGDRLSTYWPLLDNSNRDSCVARQDILLQVAPAGCQPSVVRSDLLAEQNVPVFCQIDAFKANPILDIDRIKNIRFRGDYSEDVVDVGFHPARAALRTQDKLLGSPIINNIGYVVIVLKKQEIEDEIPENIELTLSAQLDYDAGRAFGVGKSEFFLTEVDDEEWENSERAKQSFFDGRFSIRLDEADSNVAKISIYEGDRKMRSVSVQKGKSSEDIFVPGSYCQSGLNIYYDGFFSSEKKAVIRVDDDNFEVFRGSKFLNGKCRVSDIVVDEDNAGYVSLSCSGKRVRLSLDKLNQDEGVSDVKHSNDNVEIAFNNAINGLEKVADDYPNEKEEGSEIGKYYGEVALKKAIDLSERTGGKDETKLRLMQKFRDKYSSSAYEREINRLSNFDNSNAGKVIQVDNYPHYISLISLSNPKKGSVSAEFKLNSRVLNLDLGENVGVESDKIESIRLTDLKADQATVNVRCSNKEFSGRKIVDLGESITICEDNSLVLSRSDVEKVAKIRVVPRAKNVGTSTNFTISIGIEKRNLDLTPEKAQMRIDNLDESIQQWESISHNLESVVGGLQSACIATAAGLTIKNFIGGLSGGAVARQEVMKEWSVKCEEMVANGDYVSLDACYSDNKNSAQIDAQVGSYKEALKKVGANIDKFKDDKGNVDKDKYVNYLKKEYGNDFVGDKKVSDLLGNGDYYRVSDLENLEKNLILQSSENNDLKSMGSGGLESLKGDLEFSRESAINLEEAQKLNELGFAAPAQINIQGRQKILADVKLVGDANGLSDKVANSDVTHTATLHGLSREEGFEGGVYILGLSSASFGGGKNYVVEEVVPMKNGELGDKLSQDDLNKFIKTYNIGIIESADAESLNNRPEGEFNVKYYESGENRGLPAIVPFDNVGGWYAGIRPSSGLIRGKNPYDSSGRISRFWLCNVGSNKRMEFNDFGKDPCISVDFDSGQSLDNFPGLPPERTRKLIIDAKRAIEQAANQYGKNKISILNQVFDVGSPATNLPSTQCTDFMSPDDCQLLFNVCDPVICPNSRCNLGGSYHVDNVIQSGIVGSALLCLPNFIGFKGDVAIPVCLTGIKAGIDGYLSILKSHQQCLEENIKTGKMTGICDQINSVYTCEFFWRHAAPFAKNALPNLLQSMYSGGTGKGTKGGGEYLSIQNAWDNTQNSLNYMSQTYSQNSLDVFRIGSVEDVGSTFCKAFVSAKLPTSFESIIEEDSPSQFHAYFDTVPFNDATLPPTEQYKVFYHIFAGENRGVSYSVYLKDPPELSYYHTTEIIQVDSGFISKGEFRTKSKDFTAPAGYKQLCVRINEKEECGFGKVSTSFAINSLSDSFVKSAAEDTEINNEEDCISGKTSSLALLNTNFGSMAGEAVSPEQYRRGIVRICSTGNPGEGTNPERFAKVGNCGDERVGCWLDRDSVKNALSDSNLNIEGGEYEAVEIDTQQNPELLVEYSNNLKVVDNELKEIRKELNEMKGENLKPENVDELIKRVDNLRIDSQNQKAESQFLKGEIYTKYLNELLNNYPEKRVDADSPSARDTGQTESDSESSGESRTSGGGGFSLGGDVLQASSEAGGFVQIGRKILFNYKDTGLFVDLNYENIKYRYIKGSTDTVVNVADIVDGRIYVKEVAYDLTIMSRETQDYLKNLSGASIDSEGIILGSDKDSVDKVIDESESTTTGQQEGSLG